MKLAHVIRIIFIGSIIAVLIMGVFVYTVFYEVNSTLIVHYDINHGIVSGSLTDVMLVIGFVLFFELFNMGLFRIIYLKYHAISYLLPIVNSILTLLLLMYVFVILTIN